MKTACRATKSESVRRKIPETKRMDRAPLLTFSHIRPSLYRALRGQNQCVQSLPSCVDVGHFWNTRETPEAPEQSSLPRPRLGFYGVIDDREHLSGFEPGRVPGGLRTGVGRVPGSIAEAARAGGPGAPTERLGGETVERMSEALRRLPARPYRPGVVASPTPHAGDRHGHGVVISKGWPSGSRK